jgi:hypothetical protein
MVLIYSLHVAYHTTLFLLVNNIYIYIHIFIPWVSVKNVFIMAGCNGKHSKGTDLLVTAKGAREREMTSRCSFKSTVDITKHEPCWIKVMYVE